MEAIAGLSLACNVTQIVGQTLTVAKTIKEIQRRGGSSDNENLDALNRKLHLGAIKVDECLASKTLSTSQSSSLGEIKKIARELQDISTELQNMLKKLQGTDQRLSSLIKQTARTLTKRHDVQNLEKKLRDQQELLNSRLLIDLWQNSTQNVQNAETFHLMESLRFPGMNDRINQIKSIGETSFGWIFNSYKTFGNNISNGYQESSEYDEESIENAGVDDQLNISEASCRQDAWMKFESWLTQDSQEIFWISGKAGSGKSTLMKKIWGHKKTTELLKQRTDLRKSCVLRYGFWLSGSPLQRSLKGLLSSLLRQLLSFYPVLALHLLQRFMRIPGKWTFDDWSDDELQRDLTTALQTVTDVLEVGLFIDGLDEYDPTRDPRELSDFLNILARQAHVKVCVSSRPEPFWKAHFQQAPQLRLQDLNRSDIRYYVSEQLREINLLDGERHGTHTAGEFVQEIVSRAQGVFLWAHVVTRLLLRGSTNMASKNELWERLCALPEEMQALYEDMLSRLGSELNFTGPEMSLYLRVCLLSNSRHYFSIGLAVNLQSKMGNDLETRPELYTASDFERRCNSMRRRVLNICTGFLDIIESDESDIVEFHTLCSPSIIESLDEERTPFDSIEFSHRSVRDFLVDTDAGRAVLKECPLSDETILDACLQTMVLFWHIYERVLDPFTGSHLIQMITSLCRRPMDGTTKVLDISDGAILKRLYFIARHLFTNGRALPTLSEYRSTVEQICIGDCLASLLSCVQDHVFSKHDYEQFRSQVIPFPVYDCLGMYASVSNPETLKIAWDLITSTPEISHQYASYLLLYLTQYHYHQCDSLEHSFWARLVQAGASLYTNFYFPWRGYVQFSTASDLLLTLLNSPTFAVCEDSKLLEFAREQLRECDDEPLAPLAIVPSLDDYEIHGPIHFSCDYLDMSNETTVWLQINVARHLINVLERCKSEDSPFRAFISAFGRFHGDNFLLITKERQRIKPSEATIKQFYACLNQSFPREQLWRTIAQLSRNEIAVGLRSGVAETVDMYDFFSKMGYIKGPPDPAASTEPIPPFDPMPQTQEELDLLVKHLSQRYQSLSKSEQFRTRPLDEPTRRIWYPKKSAKVIEADESEDVEVLQRRSTEFFDAAEELT